MCFLVCRSGSLEGKHGQGNFGGVMRSWKVRPNVFAPNDLAIARDKSVGEQGRDVLTIAG
jgi:hypothetical protein